MKKVGEMWNLFERTVIPADAPPIQHREMKNAFYAGVFAAFELLVCDIGNNDNVSEEEGVLILNRLRDECEQFFRERMMEKTQGQA